MVIKKKKVLVVCYDAGGAEVISAYIKKYKNKLNLYCLVSGPARKIFIKKGLNKFFVKKLKAAKLLEEKKVDLVLTGVSWATTVGFVYIKKAKDLNIKTAVYLDHWSDYRRDFAYPEKGWRNNIPDELWAGDKYSRQLAKKYFPRVKIKYIPNYYFKEIKDRYKEIKKCAHDKRNNILFMSEPVQTPVSCFIDQAGYKFNEYDVLKDLLKYFKKEKIKDQVVICYHPSENRNKYNSLIEKYKKFLDIRKQKKDILEEFLGAKLIFGMMSMILVIAYLCDKKVVSYIPAEGIKCPLPFRDIHKIKEVKELSKILNL